MLPLKQLRKQKDAAEDISMEHRGVGMQILDDWRGREKCDIKKY